MWVPSPHPTRNLKSYTKLSSQAKQVGPLPCHHRPRARHITHICMSHSRCRPQPCSPIRRQPYIEVGVDKVQLRNCAEYYAGHMIISGQPGSDDVGPLDVLVRIATHMMLLHSPSARITGQSVGPTGRVIHANFPDPHYCPGVPQCRSHRRPGYIQIQSAQAPTL